VGTADRLDALVQRIRRAHALDPVAGPLSRAVADALDRRPAVGDALRGGMLGHPAHPALTDLPIGFLTSAFVLDFFGPRPRRTATLFVAAGLMTAVPTVATGLADLADLPVEDRRLGVVHAALNGLGLLAYTLSLKARLRGSWPRGAASGLVGASFLTAGAALGGHLVFREGAGLRRTQDGPPDDGPPDDGPPDGPPYGPPDGPPYGRPHDGSPGDGPPDPGPAPV
jgi:hypothetical protein